MIQKPLLMVRMASTIFVIARTLGTIMLLRLPSCLAVEQELSRETLSLVLQGTDECINAGSLVASCAVDLLQQRLDKQDKDERPKVADAEDITKLMEQLRSENLRLKTSLQENAEEVTKLQAALAQRDAEALQQDAHLEELNMRPSGTAPAIASGRYLLKHGKSTTCFSANGVYLYGRFDCEESNTKHQWNVDLNADGNYTIKSVDTGMCLGTLKGIYFTKFVPSSCSQQEESQKWQLVSVSGTDLVMLKNTQTGKCLVKGQYSMEASACSDSKHSMAFHLHFLDSDHTAATVKGQERA